MRYSRYVSVLKWLTLSLFAYVGDGVRGAGALGRGRLRLIVAAAVISKTDYIVAVVAVLGTTISPYLFLLAGRRGGRGRAGAARRRSR